MVGFCWIGSVGYKNCLLKDVEIFFFLLVDAVRRYYYIEDLLVGFKIVYIKCIYIIMYGEKGWIGWLFFFKNLLYIFYYKDYFFYFFNIICFESNKYDYLINK